MKAHFSAYVRTYFSFILVGLLVIKSVIGFWNANVNLKDMTTEFSGTFKHNFTEGLNIDEYEMARTAFYYLQTGSFICDNHFGRPNFGVEQQQTSAFRPKFNIMLHVVGISLYQSSTQQNIATADQIPLAYFGYYGMFLALIKTILFAISVYYFYRLSQFIFEDDWAKLATVLYILYPSICFYMGWLDILENIALPLLVIIVAYLTTNFSTTAARKFPKEWYLIALLAALACLVRPHVLAIFQLLLPVYALFFVWHVVKKANSPHNWRLVALMYAAIGITHLPILWQNYHDFGSLMLSSQPGLEFFQGHNAYARGTWNPYLWEQHLNDFAPITAAKSTLAQCNEKQELDYYFQVAKQWVMEHPWSELWLAIRKTAIYFFPYNYLHQRINLINFLVHFGFLGSFLWLFFDKAWRARFRDITFTHTWMWILLPIVASYTLSVVFFVCERWRLYAEPFLLLSALYFYRAMWFRFQTMLHRHYRKQTAIPVTQTEILDNQLHFSQRISKWFGLSIRPRIAKS